MIKIGIHNAYASKDWTVDYRDVMPRIAGLGFDFIEANPSRLHAMTAQQRAEIKAAAKDLGLAVICSCGLPACYDLASEDAAVRRAGIAYVKELLHTIREMGSGVYAGGNYSYWPYNYFESKCDREAELDRMETSIREVIKVAEDLGIDYAMEVLNRFEGFLLNTADEGVAFCKRIGSPRIKLNLDTFHMNIEEDSMTGALVTAKDYMVDIHFGENNRKYPGMGEMPWEEIMRTLNRIGYDGYIAFEPFMIPGGEVGQNTYLWREVAPDTTPETMDRLAKHSLQYIRSLIALNEK